MVQIVSSIVVALLATVGAFIPFIPSRGVKPPTVAINQPKASIIGSRDGNIETFLGIPFAQPPVEQLRLRPPQPLASDLGEFVATSLPLACPQQIAPSEPLLPSNTKQPLNHTHAGEDCLTLNIHRPVNTTVESKLPVLFFIHGGGFELGSTHTFDGSDIVNTSILQERPIIFVSANYRLNAFGFLPGKEIKAAGAGNLGLLDQRLALSWVADNIAQFGGDADKVTIWGESAGAISVLYQMLLFDGDHTYRGKPLFRGGIMNSGSIFPAHDIDSAKGQLTYDMVVHSGGCSDAADTLECLRSLPYEAFQRAMCSVPLILSYYSLALFYLPRPDGRVITASPEVLVQQGKMAPAHLLIGEQEDEGTLFATDFQKNLTTGSSLVKYAQTILYPEAPHDVIRRYVELYPDDPAHGAPYRTGTDNQLYPQYKRLASLLGETTFLFARRALLSLTATGNAAQRFWCFLATYNHGTPTLGTAHASDLPLLFGESKGFASQSVHSYYISFVHTLDPNGGVGGSASAGASDGSGNLTYWPQWAPDERQVLNLGERSNTMMRDGEEDIRGREKRFEYYLDHVESFRL